MTKQKHIAPLCVFFAFSACCSGQTPVPVTHLEFGNVSNGFHSETHPREKVADQRAREKNVYELQVGALNIEGRWAGEVELPIKTGDVLTPEKLFSAMEALEKAVTRDTLEGYGLRSEGEIGVLYIDVDFATNAPPAHTVDITFRPYYVHFSLVKIGDNVLPIPRSVFPTFYENVPKPLLALKPTVGISYDRAFGTALGGAFQSDLLHLPGVTPLNSPATDRHLTLNLQGTKSLDKIFFRGDAGLLYEVRHDEETLQEFNFRAAYDDRKEPLGALDDTQQSGLGSAGLAVKIAPNTRLALDAGYRYATDELEDNRLAAVQKTSANEQFNRALFDSIPRPFYGFLRAAIWEDNGWQNGGDGSYQRFAARIGYAKELPLTQNQTIGLELVAGGGHAWGSVPEHARFFGGNSPGQFLYDSPSSSTLLNLPAGPILRSFGENQAGLRTGTGEVRGGDAFWHVNLNLTFPIRFFSRPLIPNEDTDLEDASGKPITLKQLLRRQIDVTGPSMLAATLKNEGMSANEAAKKAKEILDEIKPATHYIIDEANVYTLKPLFMFDAAGLSRPGASETWLAAGGGLQLTLVTARFEIGYMRTLSGPTFGSRGNLFFRLVFQNLF